MSSVLLEVCCGSAEESVAAAQAGADRLEICAGLGVGGVTPSAALVEAAVATGVPTVVMIRSSSGWFVPSDEERGVMLKEARAIRESGADSVITGALTEDGGLDIGFLQAVREESGLPVACHRLLDYTVDPKRSLEQVVEAGFPRVLTAGNKGAVMAGLDWMKWAVEEFGEAIEVLPGGGVLPGNVRELVASTGVRSVHFSAFKVVGDGYSGIPLTEPDPEKVKAMRAALG